MKIAIVNAPPACHDEPYYDLPEFVRYSLACLAAYLLEKGYIDLCLIDAKFERLNNDQVFHKIQEFGPDVVGYTAFTNEIVPCSEIAKLIKLDAIKNGKKILNIIGGVHVTALPSQTLAEFNYFDIGVIGEGEKTFFELVQYFEQTNGSSNPTLLNKIDGIVYKDDKNKTQITALRKKIGDQTSLPRPAWDLMPKGKEYHVMSSRGCPFSCTFCMNPNGQIVRRRDVQHFLDEVKFIITECGAKRLYFCDEIMSVNKKRFLEIVDGLEKLGFGNGILTYTGQSHVSCVDDEIFRRMKETGCDNIGLGIETADPEVLKTMGKKTDLKKIKKAVAAAKRTGVNLQSLMILGHPNETLISAWRTIWFTIRINPKEPVFGVMVPYPGTKVWEWANKGEKGYKLKNLNWNEYNKQIGSALEFKYISRKQIELMQLTGYILVYVLNLRFLDLLKFIWKRRVEGFVLLKKVLGVNHLLRFSK